MADIGHYTKHDSFIINSVPDIVVTVVWNMKRRDAHTVQNERLPTLYHYLPFLVHLAAHAVVILNPRMHPTRCMHGYFEFPTDSAYRLYMVGMIMRNKYIVQVGHRKSVFTEIFPQRAHTYADINHHSAFFCQYVVAVTAASASERYKFQHLKNQFYYKIINFAWIIQGF